MYVNTSELRTFVSSTTTIPLKNRRQKTTPTMTKHCKLYVLLTTITVFVIFAAIALGACYQDVRHPAAGGRDWHPAHLVCH